MAINMISGTLIGQNSCQTPFGLVYVVHELLPICRIPISKSCPYFRGSLFFPKIRPKIQKKNEKLIWKKIV
jgi:hypothetical protein